MAAGLPVVATRSGGLTEIVPEEGLTDRAGLADRLRALWQDAAAGDRALARVRERCAPPPSPRELRAVYDGVSSSGSTVTSVTNCAAARPKAPWTIRS